jgi:(E)-4-hydroxy-3-methylbut-2-enyl-diphosphate synthase
MMLDIQRRTTRQIKVGNVTVGGGAVIPVQSMTNTKTADVEATVSQIKALEEAGCEIVRVAVPDETSARSIADIKKKTGIPIIADIHFDHRLAIIAAESGVDGLRINPGNIGSMDKVRNVADCARHHGIPIRIGVNAGSLDSDLTGKHGGATPDAMVESALRQIDMLESSGFMDIKVSLKASDVPRTVSAYRKLASKTDIPLHLGVTEAGGLFPGLVKSSLGIGMLLAEGIGDTFRVSLTRDPVEEIRAGYEILKALGIRRRGPEIVSCPTCGRCGIDLIGLAEKVEKALAGSTINLKIAIMGCVVNGPGEAKEADIGVAGGDGVGILFKKGKVVKKIPQELLYETLLEEIKNMCE